LRIPTQKEALALIRCEEIQNSAYSSFCRDLESLAREVDVGTVVENFGTKVLQHLFLFRFPTNLYVQIHNHLQKALQAYDELASRYHAETAARKRTNLVERIVSSLYLLIRQYVISCFVLWLPKTRTIRAANRKITKYSNRHLP
jgi:hypothetical protein